LFVHRVQGEASGEGEERVLMSKTDKDAKVERDKRGPIKKRDKKRPPIKEKGGMRSIRELLEEEE
jgi:hypothetical protein